MDTVDFTFGRCIGISDGQRLIASSGLHALHYIDCLTGQERKKIHCKSYGIGQVSFSHHDACVLHSTGNDFGKLTGRSLSNSSATAEIRYLCLYDNRYLQCFRGHRGLINSLSLCPIDDSFLTASDDRTVRRWDLMSNREVARIELPSRTTASLARFDHSGLVYGVLTCREKSSMRNSAQNSYLQQMQQENFNIEKQYSIKLYDARSMTNGPFQEIVPNEPLFLNALTEYYNTTNTSITSISSTISSAVINATNLSYHDFLSKYMNAEWTDFQFNHEGNNILINSNSELLWILDAFRSDQAPIPLFHRRNEFHQRLGVCYSSNDQYIITGSGENEIQMINNRIPISSGSMVGADSMGSGVISSSSGRDVAATLGGHVSPVGCVRYNPKLAMFASGCVNIALWLPQQLQQ